VRQQRADFIEHLQRQIMTRLEADVLRHFAFLSAFAILGPLLRQIQSHIDQRVLFRGRVSHVDADLTVLEFTESSAPLPLHADRFGSLLGEAGRVKHDHAVRTSQLLADLPRQLADQGLMVPVGLADKVLQRLSTLIVTIGNRLGILAVHIGNQSCDKVAGILPLLGAGQQASKRLDKPFQPLERSQKHGPIHLSFLQQRFLAKLKTSFHR
jgi:hypothetical protein